MVLESLAKTKVMMVFGSNRKKHGINFISILNEIVEIVHKYKYVGIPIDSTPQNNFKEA